MSLKEELLSRTEAEFKTLQEAIRGLDEAQLTRTMLGTWGVREILVHLAGWHREMTPVLERLARGEKPVPEGVSYDDADPWNARFVEAKRGVSVSAILTELEDSYRAFLAAARAVPEERYAPGKTAPRLVEANGPHHYREHGDQIRAWRQQEGI